MSPITSPIINRSGGKGRLKKGGHEICGEALLNTKSKIIEIDSVGQILFERSNRARYIGISVKPFKGVRVAVPYGLSFDKAKQFAQSKRNWIKKHLDKMKQVEKEHEAFSKYSTEINRAVAALMISLAIFSDPCSSPSYSNSIFPVMAGRAA